MSRLWAPLLPLGILQLYTSVNSGYFEARELKFLTNHTYAIIEWLRLPGDLVFIVGGAIPTLYRFRSVRSLHESDKPRPEASPSP